MRISPLVLPVFALLAYGSGTQPATPAETAAAAKTPDVATVKKAMTPAQLALGDPMTDSIGMVLVPIPAGEFPMGSPDSDSDEANGGSCRGKHEPPRMEVMKFNCNRHDERRAFREF